MATQREQTEAAGIVRQVLAEVEAGTLSADGPAGSRLLRRLEGVVVALETGARSKASKAATGRTEP